MKELPLNDFLSFCQTCKNIGLKYCSTDPRKEKIRFFLSMDENPVLEYNIHSVYPISHAIVREIPNIITVDIDKLINLVTLYITFSKEEIEFLDFIKPKCITVNEFGYKSFWKVDIEHFTFDEETRSYTTEDFNNLILMLPPHDSKFNSIQKPGYFSLA